MLTRIVIALGAISSVMAVVVAMQPAEFRIARSATIAAQAPAVFAQVNDFHNWRAWSPWAALDPAMAQSYGGAPAGTGAVYTWEGNAQVGAGRMTVTQSRPDDLVRIELEFRKPVPSTATAEFAFRPEGDRTVVTWSMQGRRTFVTRAVGLVMDMEAMLGGQFERGLARLAAVAESGPAR